MDSKRIVVIGATGHIGSFLVPRLVRAGHDVVTISRGSRSAYVDAPEWQHVEQVTADREQEDRDGTFGNRVVALRPDVVIDLVCFTVESAAALVAALRGTDAHLVHCGSIWRAGPSAVLPVTEDNATPPVGEYGIGKDAIARLLKEETADGGVVTTSLHPGHISGPGWAPIGPVGNLDPTVWQKLSAGEPLLVPGLGAESMHHVHADDVAQAFELAVEHRDAAAGEDFTVVAPTALTARGYAALAASWFGQEARLESVTWDRFRKVVPAEHADASWEHLSRSHVFSIDKARRLLGYAPRYTAEETVLDAVRWLVDNDEVAVARPLVV
ncbi:NAD(P)-dependent oxidoreductase [Curtobacterium sp. MCJR17_055]|uniref:NAD-dependent epimerase/dehydratase family protein n=1 Tax=unclassified Curtobacterium TaxID=257496 RepID=UPI000D90CB48|nr:MULTISPECIES: NAD(P)-dependent oxidoreductase [unclassified Curtobacterium]PYY37823.1 NAD(P)-dependent oxidoreductase [Curtobacterium sp. MCBD17_029]PYY56849.1 NAD(P)-dependent oxidoreductase [Curtobacterium sp. MCJR17_055]PYY62235.1 NAD(P)-dependent oxidoreductase [Curtobacterium sp. MCPF17_015]WIB36004.1 NAD(P)-dependent oxidoreductase [Curtobacterium sp. MCJR17_043]